MIHILWGEDTFSRDEALAQIRAELGPEDLLATNTTRLKGREMALEQLLAICQTLPFLAPWRLVLVEGLLASFESGSKGAAASAAAEAAMATLGEGLAIIPPSTVVVFLEEGLTPTNPLLQRLSALAGQVQQRRFATPKGDALRNWVQSRAQAQGKRITPPAASLLADTVGDDLRLLAQEIEKLIIYSAEEPITEPAVKLMVAQTRQENVFSLVDAIAQGQTGAALQKLGPLQAEGAATPYLLFMIARQFRLLLRIKALVQQGEAPAAIRHRLGLSEYVFRKSWGQAARYSWDKLVAAQRRLLAADLAIKTGREVGALELLITDLGSASGQQRQLRS